MQLFAKIINDYKLIKIFAKYSIFDVWQGPEKQSFTYVV